MSTLMWKRASSKLLLLLAVFQCSLWPGVQSQESMVTNCTVNVPLTAPTTVVPTGPVCISCILNNTLASNATFSGIEITPDSVKVEGGVLVVYDTEETFGVTEYDDTTSTVLVLICTNGNDSVEAAVFVEIPLVVVISEGGLVSEGGDTLQLTCSVVKGYPPPNTILWIRNGIQLNDSSDPRLTVETNATYSTLTIAGVCGSDGGEYTCLAFNAAGNSSETTTISVQARGPGLMPLVIEAYSVPTTSIGECADTTEERAIILSNVRKMLENINFAKTYV